MQTPGIIILAAGLGSRFSRAGGTGNKLLAAWPDENNQLQPLLSLTINAAQRSGLPVVLVTRPEYRAIQQLATEAGIEFLCISSSGSGESIAAAVNATQHWAGWLIQPGDMAWVTAADHLRIAEALKLSAQQVRLCWQDKPGHPVGFAAEYGPALSQLKGDSGARSLLDPVCLTYLTAHAGVIRDADLPATPAAACSSGNSSAV